MIFVCVLCDRPNHEVELLLRDRERNVNICSECIERAAFCLREERQKRARGGNIVTLTLRRT